MAKLGFKKGTTSKIAKVFIQDSTSTTGAGLIGLLFSSSGLTGYYIKEGDASATSITLATATVGTWSTGGFKEVDATNMPGVYEIGIPNAALSSANSCLIYLKGATNMVPTILEMQLEAVDNEDSVRYGLSSLPNATAGANGGLPTGNASGQVITQYPLHKNTAYNNFTFNLVSSTDGKTPLTGATVAGQVSIDGGAYTNLTNSVSEIGSGTYKVNLAAADLNGTNITLKFTATGAIQLNLTIPLSA